MLRWVPVSVLETNLHDEAVNVIIINYISVEKNRKEKTSALCFHFEAIAYAEWLAWLPAEQQSYDPEKKGRVNLLQ